MRTMLALVTLVPVVALFAAVPRAQPQRLDKEAQAKVDETVAVYGAAWNEPDVEARRQLLEKAWATNGTYTDPTAHLEGREALVQHISGFQKSLPGARIAPTSRADSGQSSTQAAHSRLLVSRAWTFFIGTTIRFRRRW